MGWPIPGTGPQDSTAGGGALLYRQRHGIAAFAKSCSRLHQRGQRGRGQYRLLPGRCEYLPLPGGISPRCRHGNWELEQITQRAKRVFSGRYALELDANRRETRLINVKEPQLAEAGVYFAVMSPLATTTGARRPPISR